MVFINTFMQEYNLKTIYLLLWCNKLIQITFKVLCTILLQHIMLKQFVNVLIYI